MGRKKGMQRNEGRENEMKRKEENKGKTSKGKGKTKDNHTDIDRRYLKPKANKNKAERESGLRE